MNIFAHNSPVTERESARKWFAAVVLGLFGFLANALPVHMFFGVAVIFGSVFSLLALACCGFAPGLLATAIASSYTIPLWGHPYAFLIFMAETVVVGVVWKKKSKDLIVADAAFWFVFGMLLVLFFYKGIMGMERSAALLIMLKQTVNGILNAFLANILLLILPKTGLFGRYKSPPLEHWLSIPVAALVLVPCVLLMIFEGRTELNRIEQLVAQRLSLSVRNASEQIEYIYQRRLAAVATLAEAVAVEKQGNLYAPEIQQRLRLVKELFPDFHNLYIADSNATTVAFYPDRNERGETTIGINFSDREYYRRLTDSLQPVISDVFPGRGGVYQPIQTISVPILHNGNFLGYASGALNLESLAQILQRDLVEGDLKITLIDPQNRIIASSDPNIKPFDFSTFEQSRLTPTKTRQLWLKYSGDPVAQMLRYQRSAYVSHSFINADLPWRIVSEAPVGPYQAALYRAYIDNMAVALVIGTLFFMLGRMLVRYLTEFFLHLAASTSDLPQKVMHGHNVSWPTMPVFEISTLIDNLQKMASAMRSSFLVERANAARLAQANSDLEMEIASRRASEEALRRSEQFLREQNNVLMQLARTRGPGSESLQAQFQRITEAASRTLGVSRVGVWFYDPQRTKILCHDLFDLASKTHTSGQELLASNYPRYFEALKEERVIAAGDAENDSRTAEFAEDYLKPLGIKAMLDAPIWMRGKMTGVICHEHLGTKRSWTTEEEIFAGAIADVIALTLEEHERLVAQDALAKSEESYRRIVDTAREGIWLVDSEYRTTYVNSRIGELFGYHPSEMLNRQVMEFVFEEDVPLLKQRILERKAGKTGHYDFRYRRKDGSELWVISSTAPILGSNGEFKGALGMFTDITDRRLAEQERDRLLQRERQARLEAEILHQTGRKLAGELELNRVLQIVTEAAAEISRAQLGLLFYKQGDPIQPQPLLYINSKEGSKPVGAISTKEVQHLAEALWACDKPMRKDSTHIPPLTVTSGVELLAKHFTIGSYLTVPIRSRSGALLGSLLFTHEQPGHFTPNEERLVVSLAAQGAIAIDNANLFQASKAELERRQRTEEQLLRREQELQHQSKLTGTIIDNASACLFLLDHRGLCTFMNVAAEQTTEYTLAEAQNESFHDLVHPGCSNASCVLKNLQSLSRRVVNEDLFCAKGGRSFPVSLSCSPILREGVSVGYVLEVRDVTEEKQARAALLEAQKKLEAHAVELEHRVAERTAKLKEAIAQMEAFSYTVSHDLRAPLRAMAGYADILQEEIGASLEPELSEYLHRISASALRLDKLIHDVLTYSRIGRTELHLEQVHLESLVQDILAQYPDLQKSKFVVQRPLHPVLGNEALLTQCLSNLFVNAVKFSKDNTTPEVRVRTEWDGRSVRLWVEDNGIGIDPAHHEKIFGIFERINNSKPYDGTGIGLAIVQKAVERMGGRVGVESRLGHGSSFWIELRGPQESKEGL